MFLFTSAPERIILLSYKAKKNCFVGLVLFEHKKKKFLRGRRENPRAVLDYNNNKGGIGTADEVLWLYSIKGASKRWPLTNFFNPLDNVALNTYIIFKDIFLSGKNRRQFSIKLRKKLCAPEQSH